LFGTFYIAFAIWSRLIILFAYGWSGYHDHGLHLSTPSTVLGPANWRISNGDVLAWWWALVFGLGTFSTILSLAIALPFLIARWQQPWRFIIAFLYAMLGLAAGIDFYTHNDNYFNHLGRSVH
jgi:hypothetical protein